MNIRRPMVCLALLFLLTLLVLAGCMGGAKVLDMPYCTMDVSPLPCWVHDVALLDGYYVGVGSSAPFAEGFTPQKFRAKAMALENLIHQIQVTIESSLEVTESQEQIAGGETLASRAVTRHLRVASSLTLTEVKEAGYYMDPSTCIFWMRLKIKREVADNLIALKQAKGLYQLTVDESAATPAQKLRWIVDATARLSDVDFSVLPRDAGNKSHLSELFARRKTELEQNGHDRTLWVFSGTLELRTALAFRLRALAEANGAVYLDTPCRGTHDCLFLAREFRSKHLVWIKANAETSTGFLGIYKGFLRVGVSRFDVDTGTLLSRQSDEGGTFAFDEGSIEWPRLLEQLLATEKMKPVLAPQ
ncbi:hypothetical protein [Desulfoluna sp.]|uniref:hypothetical protein n=1 Tax=Desulfoluna sp. TaxID=2045199 RepID=UPI002623E2D8|nr:hypothetical protein [Desulfoluna sp.]